MDNGYCLQPTPATAYWLPATGSAGRGFSPAVTGRPEGLPDNPATATGGLPLTGCRPAGRGSRRHGRTAVIHRPGSYRHTSW